MGVQQHGYFALGQVIEHVCDCSYAEFLERRIFERASAAAGQSREARFRLHPVAGKVDRRILQPSKFYGGPRRRCQHSARHDLMDSRCGERTVIDRRRAFGHS